jgi:L-ribulose-5-phosphate 3-epimerase
MSQLDRRRFLTTSASLFAGASFAPVLAGSSPTAREPLFKISLAEWSLHKELFAKKIVNLDFPGVARALGIEAVEYVNSFFKEQVKDADYLKELNARCKGEGVQSLLIMCDGLGELGDPTEAKRKQAVSNHAVWLDAAKALGCHSIRVNAASAGSFEEQQKLAADGLRALTELGAKRDLNVIVENHGGLSSNGKWLAGVMKLVDHPRCGTLPDFGNFRVKGDEWYDRYLGVEELMPFAKAVSAKSHDFNEQGEETRTDYARMLGIVLKAGYRGFVGVEYEGDKLGERDGIVATRKLLEKVRAVHEQAAAEASKPKAEAGKGN